MIWKLLPLISAVLFFLLTLCTFSLSLQPQDLSPCEFFAPLMEYNHDSGIPNDGPESLLSNVVHPKDPSKRVEIYGTNLKATYELNGKKYFSSFKTNGQQCACLKEQLKKAESIGTLGKSSTIGTCTLEHCLPKYFDKNTLATRNETLQRFSQAVANASVELEFIQNYHTNPNYKEYIDGRDKAFAELFNGDVGEARIPKDLEQDPSTRFLNSMDCFVGQIENVAEELNLDSRQLVKEFVEEK